MLCHIIPGTYKIDIVRPISLHYQHKIVVAGSRSQLLCIFFYLKQQFGVSKKWWQRNCILSLNSIVYADNPFTVLQVLTPFRVIFDMLDTIRSLKVKDQNFKIGKNYTFYFRYPNIPHQFSSTISCLLQQNTPATMFADANDHVV